MDEENEVESTASKQTKNEPKTEEKHISLLEMRVEQAYSDRYYVD